MVRAGMEGISPEERRRKENSWVHRFMPPSDVARDVKTLMRDGQPGGSFIRSINKHSTPQP